MVTLIRRTFESFKYGLEANYYVSLIITVVVSIMSFMDNNSFFDLNADVYGPLANNLKLMLVYLALAEICIFVFCTMKQAYKELTILGLFLILMIGGLEFYGEINQIPIDDKYRLFLLYTGLSHISFGILSFIPIKQDIDTTSSDF